MNDLPKTIARRRVQLPHSRTLEIVALEGWAGHVDCWLRLLGPGGFPVGQFLLAPTTLRPVADALNSLAGELGVNP